MSPDIEAEIGEARKTALASARATAGSTSWPSRLLAYCCTNCRYAVMGLSITVWNADPPRYATIVSAFEIPFLLRSVKYGPLKRPDDLGCWVIVAIVSFLGSSGAMILRAKK